MKRKVRGRQGEEGGRGTEDCKEEERGGRK